MDLSTMDEESLEKEERQLNNLLEKDFDLKALTEGELLPES